MPSGAAIALDAVPLQQLHRQMLFSLVGPHVTRLYHFVRHLLACHRAVGDLLPHELTPEEVVDAVLATLPRYRSPAPLAVGDARRP